MFAFVHLTLVALLAGLLQRRVALLEQLRGLPRYLTALGLTLFLVNWVDFFLYVALGWGRDYLGATWLALLSSVVALARYRRPGENSPLAVLWWHISRSALSVRRWNFWFLALSVFVLARFAWSLERIDGQVWCNFNFIDTPFHLSVANAFLTSSGFPPTDLDMAPFPLKYHFLADFYVAHLYRLGLSPLRALFLLNLLGAGAMIGAVWAVFERCVRLPRAWIFLAALLFLFLNTALVNLAHYAVFRPAFFNPAKPFDGLLAFPFYNFEATLSNLIEPQRGLLFSLPVILLILSAVFAFGEREGSARETAARPVRLLQALILIGLLPFSHIVGFAVLGLALVPIFWIHRAFLLRHWRWWSPFIALGILQLLYLLAYGPPENVDFDSWASIHLLPAQELIGLPRLVRRALFWVLVDGDFLVWGSLLAGLAFARLHPGAAMVRRFLARWWPYFAACMAFFILINFYRYAFDWGDSNKFVLFLNLGLALVITLGAAQWRRTRLAFISRGLWTFFFVLCVAPHVYEFYRDIVTLPDGKVLLFQTHGRSAAAWLKTHAGRHDVVLTSADNTIHFVTPLAGRPTLAGIYALTNPYRQDERTETIRRIYERCDLSLLPSLGTRFVCLSRAERRSYKISPRWNTLIRANRSVVFRDGRIDEFDSVFLFDADTLAAIDAPPKETTVAIDTASADSPPEPHSNTEPPARHVGEN